MRYVIGMLLVLAGPAMAGWSEDAERVCTGVDDAYRLDRANRQQEVLHSHGYRSNRWDGPTSRAYSVCYVHQRRAHECLTSGATNTTCPAPRRPAPASVISACMGNLADMDWSALFRCAQANGYN